MRRFSGFWLLDPLPVPPSGTMPVPPPGTMPNPEGQSHEEPAQSIDTRSPPQHWPHIPWLGSNESSFVNQRGPSAAAVATAKLGQGNRMATSVRLHQEVLPAVTPPAFLAHYVRGITANTTLEVLHDFQLEAARIRYRLPEGCNVKDELKHLEAGCATSDWETNATKREVFKWEHKCRVTNREGRKKRNEKLSVKERWRNAPATM